MFVVVQPSSHSISKTIDTIEESYVSLSRAQKKAQMAYRKEVERLVSLVVPDEVENVDVMMEQFLGREEELISTLTSMAEQGGADSEEDSDEDEDFDDENDDSYGDDSYGEQSENMESEHEVSTSQYDEETEASASLYDEDDQEASLSQFEDDQEASLSQYDEQTAEASLDEEVEIPPTNPQDPYALGDSLLFDDDDIEE